MNRLSTLGFMLLIASATSAQSIYFSPIDAAPVLLNASYTGMFDGKVRVSAQYQNAWRAVTVPYITYGISADMPVFIERNGSYLAAGLQLLRDNAGDGNLANFYGVASVAYHKVLSKPRNERSCELAIGVQGGYAQKMLDIAKIYFGNEFANGYFSPWGPMGIGKTINFYTVNSGISFSHATGRKFSYTIGLAGNNINQPGESIEKKNNSEVGLDMNFSGTFGANWLIVKRLTLRPAIYYCTLPSSTELIAGTELQYNFGDGARHIFVPNMFIGAWYRTGDAITFSTGIQLASFRIGIGLDHNVSTLNNSNGIDGIYFQIRYIAPQKASAKKRIVSCNRF